MSIIEKIKENFSPEFISELATQLGESESRVSKAIAVLLPATLGNICINSKNENILKAISDIDNEKISKNLLSESQQNKIVNSIKETLFTKESEKLFTITEEHSGIEDSNSKIILNTVIAATLETLKNEIQKQNIDAKNISELLNEQKSLICSIIPAGLSLESFGLENKDNSVEKIIHEEKNIEKPQKPTQKLPKATNKQNNAGFWNWLLPLILLGLAAWFFWKFYEKENLPEKIKIEEKK